MKNNSISKLTIKDNQIYLDGMKIKGVTDYDLKNSIPEKKAELTLKLIVSTVETAQECQNQEQLQYDTEIKVDRFNLPLE